MEKMCKEELLLCIADTISSQRKRSERFVGVVPYTLNFEIRNYTGISLKPEKIDILNKTIINLVGKGVTEITLIADKLGFDMLYDLDHAILMDAIRFLKSNLQLVNENRGTLSLTQTGMSVFQTGKYVKEYTAHFDLYVIPAFPAFTSLKECINDTHKVIKDAKQIKTDDLTLGQIKCIAEKQASHVQFEEGGLQLMKTQLDYFRNAKINLHVCFLQNIADNSIRTVVLDDYTKLPMLQLSDLFDSNLVLRDKLLQQCLKNEVKNECAEKVENGDKPLEQIRAEELILADTNDSVKEIVDSVNERLVGAILDSAEFEKELHEIFETHQNEEIWMVSPWIRNRAFLRNREPLIRKFLDQGGSVFVGYSAPERLGEEMVEPKSMEVLKRLDYNYERFYYAELPKFHYKNVIEYKNGKTSLYTGSFNVLSFCIDENTEYYRMEQMMIANESSANVTRNNYIQLFGKQYIERLQARIETISSGCTLDVSKLRYLYNFDSLRESFQYIAEIAKAKDIQLDYDDITEVNQKDLVEYASKIIELPYQEDSYVIQSLLAGLLFLFENAKETGDYEKQNKVEQKLFRMLQRNSIYNICRFGLRRGREDERKSIVRIVCNDFNFEFGEISLPKNIFMILNKHKEVFNFKEANIKLASRNLKQLLYNSTKMML